ncbi:MAG TPA: peroxiredoxin-like family protein [Ktedonobacteraceae bacterium]|nr:peroxiredoxin-like family protein [Ktedonobacteraceae bacterium]
MAIEPQITSDMIQQQVQALAKGTSKVSTEDGAVLGKATQALIASGIAGKSAKVGDQAPDFTLPNVDGNTVQLAQLLARGPVVLVFYRGAWCPYCNIALHTYQAVLPAIEQAGATLVAISPQTPDNSLSFAEKLELRYPVLSDSGNAVARKYGLVFKISADVQEVYKKIGMDLTTYNGDASWELPMPGTFVIAQDGTIKQAFVDADHTKRAEPSAILDALHTLSR